MLPKKSRKPAKKSAGLTVSSSEVAHLEAQALSHQRSESAWQRMTTVEDEDDGWNSVEEHLLSKSQQQDRSIFRWKHFAK